LHPAVGDKQERTGLIIHRARQGGILPTAAADYGSQHVWVASLQPFIREIAVVVFRVDQPDALGLMS
ncbi:MAG TPA: hypothetical protein VG099_10800, partial [Gemmataceae bacterium]|nr:hypothetical protein [Gemmataceae bacterium]